MLRPGHALIIAPDGSWQHVPLPYWPSPDCRLGDGPQRPTTERIMPVAIEHARRMVPWCTWLFAPTLWTEHAAEDAADFRQHRLLPDGRTFIQCSGVMVGDFIAIATDAGAAQFLTTIAHEAWHASAERMDGDTLAALDAVLIDAMDYGSGYFDDADERRARAFESLVAAAIAGVPIRGVPMPFEWLWTGEFGREIQGRLSGVNPPAAQASS